MLTASRQLFLTTPVTATAANGPESSPGRRRCLRSISHALWGDEHALTVAFSMGNAVLLDAYTEFRPTPACMLIGGAFSSAGEGAIHACFQDGCRMRFPTSGIMLQPSLIAILRCWWSTVMLTGRIQSGWASASTKLPRNRSNLSLCTGFITMRPTEAPVSSGGHR